MPYDELENGISLELSEARRSANEAEAEVARHLERVEAIVEKIQAANTSIDALRQQMAAKAKLVAEGDAEAMAAAKQLASKAQDKTAERDVLTAAQEAATADLRAAEAAVVTANRRVGFEEAKEYVVEASGLVEALDECLREFVKTADRLQEVANDFTRKTGDQGLLRLVKNRHRFAAALRAADLQRFADLVPIYASNRLSLTDQIGRFLKDWIETRGIAPISPTSDEASDVLPAGCRLDHRGQGRWHAYGPDGAQVGALHMSRTDAIAALRVALMAA